MAEASKLTTDPIKLSKKDISDSLLVEIAWEVVNQVGGIYTVLRSKSPYAVANWGDNYCLLGPYVPEKASIEFDLIEEAQDDPYFKVVTKMRKAGYRVMYGRWLVTGRPKAILFDLSSVNDKLGEIKYHLWQDHGIGTPDNDFLINGVVMFGEMVRVFLAILAELYGSSRSILAHFHEWMSASAIPAIRKNQLQVTTIFTTHATILGRYIAMNDPVFYDHLPFFDWSKEAKHFNIESTASIERAAAHGCHVFTTVSEVTAQECRYLLGRDPDVILPNGINNQRFEAMHEFQNLHLQNKKEIHNFTMTHFFQSYNFDLDKTVYFFTSGRYEFLNKGYDLTLEALAKLNHRLKIEKSDMTVVMFFITKKPYSSMNAHILQSRAILEELKYTIESIKNQVGDNLFYKAAATNTDHRLPELNQLVDDYWRLRFRRTFQSWKTDRLPSVITHDLYDDDKDEILNFLRVSNLINKPEDRVKIVYHPEFINAINPLWRMEYNQFVRGCHLGIFPSYYEPWGYTPLECIASGVPAITSDLAGFGDYVLKTMKKSEDSGIYVVNRFHKSFGQSAEQLTNMLHNFVKLKRRERIDLRFRTESSASLFDWGHLGKYYNSAYKIALKRKP
ncbi:MAG: glycosyltransferase [Bacteroidetes bacterium]|nr:glycosyltransferase [Bacteroidota bacterium]MDA1119081.1 glycosyltransferase [Bacteroidota bacterium]